MSHVTILGSGAAPGVPSLSCGWGNCNPNNPKNRRMRAGTFIEIDNTKILIDTSPDIRSQLIDNNICRIDAVLYSHAHADHLHGIDDLREITRIRLNDAFIEQGQVAYDNGVYNFDGLNKIGSLSIECYALRETATTIKGSFPYLVDSPFKKRNPFFVPSFKINIIKPNKPFYVKGVKITPLKLLGHRVASCGYAFNDGEIVHIADFKTLASSVYKQIKKRPKLLILPLTTPFGQPSHAGFDEVMEVINKINPEKVVINHMATECDYDDINARTPDFVTPAYDGMKIEL